MAAISEASFIVKPVCLEHRPILGDKSALGVIGDLVGGFGVVQDDLREDMVGSAADSDVEIIFDLAAEDVGIGSLGCQDQVDAEGSALSGNHGEAAFNFADDLLSLRGTDLKSLPESIRYLTKIKLLDLGALILEELPDWLPELNLSISRNPSESGINLCDTYVKGIDIVRNKP